MGLDRLQHFERPDPKYKVEKPPFYDAWATPVIHDCYTGLRINMKCQVTDMQGEVIQGLYCGGESAYLSGLQVELDERLFVLYARLENVQTEIQRREIRIQIQETEAAFKQKVRGIRDSLF